MINNRFHILRFLGEGRSKVFLCTDKFYPGSLFAIKLLPAAAITDEIDAFKKEFNTLQKFRHPNIVKVYEYSKVMHIEPEDINAGIEKGSEFFIMEYCEGKKVSDFEFKNEANLLFEAIEQISSTLFFIHLSDHIYFDLKAENIIASRIANSINIKFIDFGLCEKYGSGSDNKQRGTAAYIAPEIIENSGVDYRADLYSFGVLIYKLVYGCYPITGDDELTIYNRKLKGNIRYPDTNYPELIIEILRKLLATEPSDRFTNALQLLNLLGCRIDNHIHHWFTATSYAGRDKDLQKINDYIDAPERREVLVIKGDSGSGRSAFANKIKGNFDKVVYLENITSQDPKYFPQFLSNKIIFNKVIFNSLNEAEFSQIQSILAASSGKEFETLKSILVQLTRKEKFILLIDDFDLLDEVVKEYLLQIFPILQINQCKVILFRDLTEDQVDAAIKSKKEIIISTLNTEEIHNFLKQNFAPFFPKSKLEVLILRHSDHLPGNIIQFIRDLVLFDVIRFENDKIIIDDTDSGRIISWSQNAIYENRIAKVEKDEMEILQVLSAFEINIDISVLSSVVDYLPENLDKILLNLSRNNIIYYDDNYSYIQFTSKAIKSFIYDKIENKEVLHKKLASGVRKFRNFNIAEIARQYELSKEYDTAYTLLLPEIERAKKVSAFSYLKKLFSGLCSLPLSPENLFSAKLEYIDVLLKSGDPGAALKIIEKFHSDDEEVVLEILARKGICLINTGRVEEGKIILLQELEKISDSYEKTELILEIANAELNTNEFSNVYAICKGIIEDKFATSEQHGRAYNFLGIVEIYKNDNPDGAISYFEKALSEFEASGLQHRIARLKINIGNIYNMKGEHSKAEEYWNSSLQINTLIGDIEQEALLLMNYGIFNYDKCNYEKAHDYYNRAGTIFSTTGNLNGEALALVNSAETHLICCEYSKSLVSLSKARDIFISTGNREEEASCLYLMLFNYYYLGADDNFISVLKNYEEIILSGNLGEKHENQYRFMDILNKIAKLQIFDNSVYEAYKACIFRFFNSDNIPDFIIAVYEIVKILVKRGEYKEAAELLTDERIKKTFQRNNVSAARYFYLSGMVSYFYSFSDDTYQSYLFKAYELVKEQSITELTWQVLYSLGESYYERGLYKNSQIFLNQSKLLLNFIAENIDDEFQRISYLAQQERKNIIGNIEKLEKLITGL